MAELAYTIDEVCNLSKLGRTTIYAAIQRRSQSPQVPTAYHYPPRGPDAVSGKFAGNTMLPALGYRSKRRGWGAGSEWFVWNLDRNWKEQMHVITNAELWAAGDAQRNARHARDVKSGRHVWHDDYLDDVS